MPAYTTQRTHPKDGAQIGLIVLDEASTPLRQQEPGAPTASGAQDGFEHTWVMILPQGEFDTTKYGRLDFTRKVLSEIKRNFDGNARGIDIALDYDHQASDGDTKAPGWIEALALGEDIGRDAGLWAKVRWTTLGLADVKAQIYRYISAEYQPEYHNDFTGQDYTNVLIGCTLTNRPVMKIMPAIALSERRPAPRAPQGAPRGLAGPGRTSPIRAPHDAQHDAPHDVRDGTAAGLMSEAPRRSWYPRRGYDW